MTAYAPTIPDVRNEKGIDKDGKKQYNVGIRNNTKEQI